MGRSLIGRALFGSGAALVAVGATAADVIEVPAEAPSIQAAIDLAAPGDEVLVAPGVYNETVDFLGKAVVLRSVGGPAQTTIDAGGVEAFAVVIQDIAGPDPAVVSGFTITGGLGATSGSTPTGGGLLATDAAVTVENSVFTSNTSIQGGAIDATGSVLTIRDSTFLANNANSGGAISAVLGETTITGSTFEDNRAVNFGGAIAVFGGALTITDTSLARNGSNQFGGALYVNAASLDASGIEAVENGLAEFRSGGAIQFSTFGGGAIYTTHTTGRIDRSSLTGNRAFAGGGIYVAGSGVLEVVNCVLSGAISGLGGGVYANASSPLIVNSTIINNDDGGIFTTFNAEPVVRNSILSGNASLGANEINGNGEVDVAFTLIDGPFSDVLAGPGILETTPDLDAAFAPLPGSPAIDAGDNGSVPAGVSLDLLGAQRIVDGDGSGGPVVDLGAVEFGSTPPPPAGATCVGDLNGDGSTDAFDFTRFVSVFGQTGLPPHTGGDLDGDGDVDISDFGVFTIHFGCAP